MLLTELVADNIVRIWGWGVTPTRMVLFMTFRIGNTLMEHQGFPGINRSRSKHKDLVLIVMFLFSFCQVKSMMQEKQYAIQIKEALEHIKSSQNAVTDHFRSFQMEAEAAQQSKLKSKGKKKLSNK